MFNEENDHIVLVLPDGSVVYQDGYDPRIPCEMYYCYECPKYGDDCDGDIDNKLEKEEKHSRRSTNLYGINKDYTSGDKITRRIK